MAAFFNTHLIGIDAANTFALRGMPPRVLSQGTADGANDQALARRCAR